MCKVKISFAFLSSVVFFLSLVCRDDDGAVEVYKASLGKLNDDTLLPTQFTQQSNEASEKKE